MVNVLSCMYSVLVILLVWQYRGPEIATSYMTRRVSGLTQALMWRHCVKCFVYVKEHHRAIYTCLFLDHSSRCHLLVTERLLWVEEPFLNPNDKLADKTELIGRQHMTILLVLLSL